MAKTKKTENAEGAAEATEAKTEKAPKPEKVYFLGSKWCAANSVFGNIKSIIATNQNIAEGKGVSTSFIVEEMLTKFQPKKSANYGEKYIRAYVRDLEKFGYATTDASQAVAELTTPPEKVKKEPKKTSKVSETGQRILDKMNELTSEADYNSSASTITAETLATALEMKPLAVGKAVESLVKNGYLTFKEEGENVFVLFTANGWDHVHPKAAA